MSAITPLRSGEKPRRDPLLPALSPLSIIPVSLLLFILAVQHAASYIFGGTEREPPKSTKVPFLVNFRDEPGRDSFVDYRLYVAPIFYGVGHILPAIAWTLFIPLQHSRALRAKSPTLHRVAGYIILTSSLALAITGLLFHHYNLAFLHPDTFHLHRPWKEHLPWVVVPNAQIAILFLSPWTIFTVYKTLTAARKRDFATHKFWASMLTLAGLSIHLERWTYMAINLVGLACSFLPLHIQDALNIPREEVDFRPGEMAGFSLSLWLGIALAGLWSYELCLFVGPSRRARGDGKTL